jgi:hypothetical protein
MRVNGMRCVQCRIRADMPQLIIGDDSRNGPRPPMGGVRGLGFVAGGYFRTGAALSDAEMRSILQGFEQSEDFSLFVKPYLAGI